MLTTLESSLTCMINQLPAQHSEAEDIKVLLVFSKNFAEAYSKTWNSIRWNRSNSKVKKRVRAQLTQTAGMVYQNLCEAGAAMQEYEAKYGALPEAVTAAFTLAYYEFCTRQGRDLPQVPEEHKQQADQMDIYRLALKALK